MLSKIRRLPSPALVISAIALIAAIGGGSFAIAASGKAKTTKIATKVANKQISKRAPDLTVDHASSADNATIATSATNATTATSATTATNATGLAGPLASGQTMTGVVATAGHFTAGQNVDETAISFPVPLAATPSASGVVPVGGPSTMACSGTAAAPAAAPGRLCVYETANQGTTGLVFGLTKFGASVNASGQTNNTDYEVQGVWAVAAP